MTDKYVLRGFVTIPALANNVEGQTSPLGELSSTAKSYSRELGYYHDPVKPNVELVSFTSRTETPLGDPVTEMEVSAKFSEFILTVSQWLFTEAVSSSWGADVETVRRMLLAKFPDIADCEIGEMEVAKGTWLPSFLSFKYDYAGATDNKIQVWYSNEAFEAQYPDYEIIVCSSVMPIDIYQQTRSKVLEALAKFNLPDHHKYIIERTNGVPFTYPVSRIYDWHDREEEGFTAPTNWTVAIYGRAGNNPALIKKAIADYILANSNYGIEDWIPVFPDIFTSTEFSIIPVYRVGVVDETPRGSLYSPVLSYNLILPLAQKYIKYTAPAGHIVENLQVTTMAYKSLAFLVCGGTQNRGHKSKFTDWHPTYATIGSKSIDFNRMNPYTAEFTRKLIEATIIAEEMDEYSFIKDGYAKIVKDDQTFIGFEYDNVLYLILSRLSFLEKEDK